MDDVSLQLRRLRQQAYAASRRREQLTGLSHWTLQTALLICLITNYDFSAGAEWLFQKRRRGTPLPEESDPAQVVRSLENVFLEADVEHLADLVDDSSPLNGSARTVRSTAQQFVRGFRLAQWVRQRNLQGAVVPTRSLIHRLSDPTPGSEIAPPLFSASSSGRVWASRWRQKFGAKHMALKVQDTLPLESLRQKVLFNFFGWFLCDFVVPDLGTIFGPRFWNPFHILVAWSLNRVHKMVPKTGTRLVNVFRFFGTHLVTK